MLRESLRGRIDMDNRRAFSGDMAVKEGLQTHILFICQVSAGGGLNTD